MLSKQCQSCGSIFYKKKPESKNYWETKKYCSRECSLKFTTIAKQENFGQRPDDFIPWNKDIKYGEEMKSRLNLSGLSIGRQKGIKRPGQQGELNHQWKGRIQKKCVICNKEFSVAPWLERKRFCSHDCYHKWHRGKNSPVWTDNYKKRFKVRIMELPEYKKWRLEVFKRDNFTCQICGENKSGEIEAHHLNSVYNILKDNEISDIEDVVKCSEMWDNNNGQTLCKKCHRETDNYGLKSKKLK